VKRFYHRNPVPRYVALKGDGTAMPKADNRTGLDSTELRAALGQYPTGVAVATTCSPAGPVGVTINSFGSLSLEPPLILWCLRRRSVSLAAFTRAEYFAVNILAVGQERVARQFAARASSDAIAGPRADRFAGVGWHLDPDGLPLLDGAVAVFTCRRAAQVPGGDHVIIIGELLGYDIAGWEPLIFHCGRYSSLAATVASAALNH
jgi:flavin reductase (DIM6/NTAB) family NADH-FMN oxidoreductase RutF